jgi:hypothetical protein
MELHNTFILKDEDWTNVRFKYFMDMPTWWFAFNAILHQKNMEAKPKALKGYTIQFIEHAFNLDLPVNYIKRLQTADYPAYYYKANGFISSDHFRNQGERPDKDRVKRYLESWKKKYKQCKDITAVNEVEEKKIHDLIEEFKSMGINTIFLLPPKSDYASLENQMALFNSIPVANRLNMADPVRFPEFYDIRYADDNLHFNMEGARLYTLRLTKEFNQLLETYYSEN